MPRFNANLNITTGKGDTISASKSGSYAEVFSLKQRVDDITTFTQIFQSGGTKGVAQFPDAKFLLIKNSGNVGAELLINSYERTDATPDAITSLQSESMLLASGDFIFLPNIRKFAFDSSVSAGDAYDLTNQVPNSNMYVAVDNAAAGDPQIIGSEFASSTTATVLSVEEGEYFFVGDLVRVEDEIMEVTSISGNNLTVIRGTHGSTAATHANTTPLRFPFFNAFNNFTAATGGYDKVQTNQDGKYLTTNFFGYGRNTDGSGNQMSMGLVPGSICGKFYSKGYQEMNMSGITSSTNSGLAVSTEYKLDITVDGGTKFQDLTFTTDSSDVTFGGTNGVISKIQEALNTQFYTAGNLFEKKVTVSIVNGDLRFTSGSYLSTSAILIEDTTDSGSLIDASAVGRFPAAAKIGSPVASALPPDTLLDRKTGIEVQNVSQMFYDDGHGNIKGKCQGEISYSSGKLKLLNAPPNAEFVVTANYGSAHSGGILSGSSAKNTIHQIKARSCNQKIDTIIEIIGIY